MRIVPFNLLGILSALVVTQVALAQPISVSLPLDAVGIPGSAVDIPIKVNDLTSQNILSFQATLTFDDEILAPTGLTTANTISDSLDALFNIQPGRMLLGAYGIHPLAGSGTLVAVRFEVNPRAEAGRTTALVLERFIFNSNFPPVETSNGMFSVSGAFPQIQIFPNSGDYGSVLLRASAVKSIRIGNSGLASLVVDRAMLMGSHADAFSIPNGGAPFIVACGDSHDLQIRFSPATLGEKNAVLEITSNDPKQNKVEIGLHGAGILAPEQPKPTYAFPNPFDPSANPIKIYLAGEYSQSAVVTIKDGHGNPLRILSDSGANSSSAGLVMSWDGRDQRGDFVPNGVYFYVIENGRDGRLIGKIVVLR